MSPKDWRYEMARNGDPDRAAEMNVRFDSHPVVSRAAASVGVERAAGPWVFDPQRLRVDERDWTRRTRRLQAWLLRTTGPRPDRSATFGVEITKAVRPRVA